MKPPKGCTRDTSKPDWTSISDAVRAWQQCACMCCQDKLDELPRELTTNTNQTTL